jgi:membrane-bound metal-dependent hydrolase YbcI (DUF457 family)
MFAGHFAAGLALRGRAPRVPLTVLLIGVFVLDILWVIFGVLHWETPRDDWSHSLLMSILWASLFALVFWRFGAKSCAVIWLAVFSHFVLDLIVQGGTLYPGAPLIRPFIGERARVFQLMVCVGCLAVYVYDARRSALPAWRTWTVCAIVGAMNGRFLLGM